MARVFISFVIEDQNLRDFLVGQKRNVRTLIDFTDFSVKEPWSSSWKKNCSQRIKSCGEMIGIITLNTPHADAQLWELKCVIDENIPLMLNHGHRAPERKLTSLPRVISERMINIWTEHNDVNFLNRLG